jgi:uncharacterized protein YbjT (DUF2867 family)
MPVIVIGADTDLGREVVAALLPRAAEMRAFVTDPAAAATLKERGVKVALGDVSDASHVGAACRNAFCAVLIAAAAGDGRERAFAADPDAVVAAWTDALRDAGVTRAIWVRREADPAPGAGRGPEEEAVVAASGRAPVEVAAEVADLEAARRI